MTTTLVTPPSGEPLSLAEMKAYLRVSIDNDDGLISSLIAAARARIEALSGLALISRTLRLTLSDWPISVLETQGFSLPLGPSGLLQSVYFIDGNDTVRNETSAFEIDDDTYRPRLCPKPGVGWRWPRSIDERIEITWTAGFGEPEDVPEDLIHAVRLLVTHMYEHRNGNDWRAVRALPAQVRDLLVPYWEARL